MSNPAALAGVIIGILLVSVDAYRDIRQHRRHPDLWGLLTFFFSGIGLAAGVRVVVFACAEETRAALEGDFVFAALGGLVIFVTSVFAALPALWPAWAAGWDEQLPPS